MRIALIVDPARTRAWQARLAKTLRAQGHRVDFIATIRSQPLPIGVTLLEAIEVALGLAKPERLRAACRVDARDWLRPIAEADIAIDLATPGGAPDFSCPVLRLVFDGGDEDAAIAALLTGRPPAIALLNGAGAVHARAVPAVEARHGFLAAFDDVLTRAVTVCRIGLARRDHVTATRTEQTGTPRAGLGLAAGCLASAIAAGVGRRLDRLVRHPEHWRIGWRQAPEAAIDPALTRHALPEATLADDGRRFFADPLATLHEGTIHVFCEEFPYATSRGLISHFTIDEQGRPGPVRPVLERPLHLSYPFVFAHEGNHYMLPETSVGGRLELYRADPFPDRWVFDRVIIENQSIADATLIAHAGRWWLFTASAEDGGSDWDCLSIFHAPSPLGPFEAAEDNPVVLDAGLARPAGPMFRHAGRLIRPVQDCRRGYGRAVRFAEVTMLARHGFAQRPLGALLPAPGSRVNGVHTFQRLSAPGRPDIELFDLVGPIMRPRA